MSTIYVGIDPGKQGSIVSIDSETGVIEKRVTPVIGKGKGSEYNKKAIKELFWHFKELGKVVVVLEDVHSIYGTSAGSNFDFGRGLGIIEGLLEALEITYYKVAPKQWQAVCFQGVRVIEKPGTKAKGRNAYDTKAMALVAVNRLYPKLDLRASDRCKVPHNGIVDGLLLAHYAKLKY